jgi:hypothetical protein
MEGLQVGRIVHYVAYGTPGGEYAAGAHRAAIIVEIPEKFSAESFPEVTLSILNPTGMHWNKSKYSSEKTPGTWHWPEKT